MNALAAIGLPGDPIEIVLYNKDMSAFLQQAVALLTSNPGSLAYHLILAFTILGVLLVVLGQMRGGGSVHGRRMVLGLCLLLAFQFILFAAAGLSWQGLLDGGRLLPLLDRAVILFSLLVIIWLWAFPDRIRNADVAALLIGMLLLTVGFLGIVWFYNQPDAVTLSATSLDQIAGWMALCLAVSGILLLLALKPAGWAAGAVMLVLISLGLVGQYIAPSVDNQYQGVVRLAMLAAFPLFFLLPLRFSHGVDAMPKYAGQEACDTTQKASSDTPPGTLEEALLMQSFMSAMLEAPSEQACLLVNKTIARYMHADICLLVLPQDEAGGGFLLQCGYDGVQELPLAGARLDKQQAPVVASALRQGRAINLPARSTSPDLTNIAEAIGLAHCGPLMFAPIISSDGQPFYGILLISPYTHRSWTADDLSGLARISKPMVYFLQLKQQIAALQAELVETRAAARLARTRLGQEVSQSGLQDQVESLREQLHLALDEVAVLKESLGNIKPNGAHSSAAVPAQVSDHPR